VKGKLANGVGSQYPSHYLGTWCAQLQWSVCTCLTQLCLMVEVYIVLLYKVQLRVSALDNCHLQVVLEILSKQLYETYMGCIL